MNDLFRIIKSVAEIPSFTGHERLLFPFVKNFLNEHIPGHEIVFEDDFFGMIVEIPGNANRQPLALSAHLDKIDHWGVLIPELVKLTPRETKRKLFGAMDDAVGVGVVLWLARWSQTHDTPPLYLFLSCREEQGMVGAARIAIDFQETGRRIPEKILNIDTCPILKKKAGTIVYSRPNYDLSELIQRFKPVVTTEGINDITVYRREFPDTLTIAVEPAIRDMHTVNESVHKCDVEKSIEILKFLLTN